METNYNDYAKTFAQSRKDMSWPELDYFFSIIKKGESILDLACGSGRLLQQYVKYFGIFPDRYLGIDISEGLIQEAKKLYQDQEFQIGDMRKISHVLGGQKYKNIFCIAGFHHLGEKEERIQVLQEMYQALEKGGKIYMTNWSLHTGLNQEKYKKSQIQGSKNNYGSYDYEVKIGEHTRYYHSFCLDEISELASLIGFKILENRIFDTGRNTLTILEK